MSYLKHKPGSIEELAANEATKLNDNAYQDMFKKELDKAGKGIGGMSPKEKKDFFNKVDDKYKAKNEEDAYDKDDEKPKPKPKPKKEELTSGQKKLPPALQKAIKDKETKSEAATHKMPDGTVMKGAKHKDEVEETHTGQTAKANRHQKSANGDPKPMMKFKTFKEAMNTIGDSEHQKTKNEPQMKKSVKDKDVKTIKGNTDAGTKPTPVDTTPEIDFKN